MANMIVQFSIRNRLFSCPTDYIKNTIYSTQHINPSIFYICIWNEINLQQKHSEQILLFMISFFIVYEKKVTIWPTAQVIYMYLFRILLKRIYVPTDNLIEIVVFRCLSMFLPKSSDSGSMLSVMCSDRQLWLLFHYLLTSLKCTLSSSKLILFFRTFYNITFPTIVYILLDIDNFLF